MKIKVKGFLTLRRAMDDRCFLVVDIAGPTIRGVLHELSNQFGERFRDSVFDPHTGEARDRIVILVNGRHYRSLTGGLDSELRQGDEVAIFRPSQEGSVHGWRQSPWHRSGCGAISIPNIKRCSEGTLL
jgi:molybdopterin converting factor small subunit